MALIKCPECGHDVSDTAASCPSCGYGIKKAKPVRVYYQKTRGRWGFPLAAAILATLYFEEWRNMDLKFWGLSVSI